MVLDQVDYILTAVIVLGLPIYGVWEHRRLKRWTETGTPHPRIRTYQMTMAIEWALSLAILAQWVARTRRISDLGLGWDTGTGSWVGIALTLVACTLLVVQTIVVLRDPTKLASVRRQHDHLQEIIPRGRREKRWWIVVSATAGICEELIYRGFLIAVLTQVSNIWASVFLSSLAFGVAHAYQGAGGIVKTAAVGLTLAGLYVLTGSLWVPIILHAIVDLNSGYLVSQAFESKTADDTEEES